MNNRSKSKFAGVFEARKPQTDSEPVAARADPETDGAVPGPRQRGRPAGKRSSVDHTQTTAYIRHDTHKRVKRALLDDGRDFSELVEDLLLQWVNSRT